MAFFGFIFFVGILFMLVGLPLLWVAVTYNGLVRLRNQCRWNWQDNSTNGGPQYFC